MKASDKPDAGSIAAGKYSGKPDKGVLPDSAGTPLEAAEPPQAPAAGKGSGAAAPSKALQAAKAQIQIPVATTAKLPDLFGLLKGIKPPEAASPSPAPAVILAEVGEPGGLKVKGTASAGLLIDGLPIGMARETLLGRVRDTFEASAVYLEQGIARVTSTGNAQNDRQAMRDLLALLERDPALFKAMMADMQDVMDAPPVLDNPLSRPERRIGLFQELIGQLARPESISQGQGTVTCAASVAQVMLLHVDPGAYYDLVRDLIVKGSHTTKGGHVIEFPRDLPRRSGRTLLDAAIQGVLYNEAQSFPATGRRTSGTGDESEGQSNASRPAGTRPRGRGNQGAGGAQYGGDEAEGGLYTGQIDRLIEELTGKPWVWEDITDADDKYRDQLWRALKAHITGERDSIDERFADFEIGGNSSSGDGSDQTRAWGVPVGIYTAGGAFHEVLIQGFEKGDVVYYDPATGRQERASEQIFLESLCQVLVPDSGWKDYRVDVKTVGEPGSAAAALGRLLE